MDDIKFTPVPILTGNYPDDVPNDSDVTEHVGAHVEIEVTPDMIEAGEEVLLLGWRGEERDAARAVFENMWRVMKRKSD